MTDEYEILPPEGDDAVETVEIEADTRKKGIGYPVFLLGLLLASALGAVGGGAVAYSLKSDPVNLTPMQTKMTQLDTEIQSLQANQAKLSRMAKAAPVVPDMPDLSALDARITALETAPAPVIDIPNFDPEALSQLKAAQEAGFEWPDAGLIEETLDAMATRIETVEAEMAARPLYQAEVVATVDPAPLDESGASDVKIATRAEQMPFPKTALMTSLNDLQTQGGFFDRMRKKHIRVKDSDDPEVLMSAIEAALARGDIETAKTKFDQLPSPMRSTGQAWRNSLD